MRRNFQNFFITIPSEILEINLSLGGIGLYLTILSIGNSDSEISLKELYFNTTSTEREIIDLLIELKEKNLIEIIEGDFPSIKKLNNQYNPKYEPPIK